MIWIGYEPKEAAAFAVTRHSLKRHLKGHVPVKGLSLEDMRRKGLYWRPTETRVNEHGQEQLWDTISEAPMSTEFAITRFLVPELTGSGWAVFMDCDMLTRGDLGQLFRHYADDRYAVLCVKHNYQPKDVVKKDSQVQTSYARKNWSSFMFFNCDHPANKRLTVEMVNARPGRDLHRFCWLEDHEIGTLPVEYNWLVGYSSFAVDPKVVHYTDGLPSLPQHKNAPFASEWWNELEQWALQ